MGQYARAKVGWAHQPANDTTPESVKKQINEIYAQVGLDEKKI
jgi:hypothetical protein